jgi:hypothetical protein
MHAMHFHIVNIALPETTLGVDHALIQPKMDDDHEQRRSKYF